MQTCHLRCPLLVDANKVSSETLRDCKSDVGDWLATGCDDLRSACVCYCACVLPPGFALRRAALFLWAS